MPDKPAAEVLIDEAAIRRLLAAQAIPVIPDALRLPLVKVAEGRLGPSIVDELAALVSLLFLASALASYLAMRAAVRAQVSRHLELIADQTFLGGLVSLVAIGMFFAYEII